MLACITSQGRTSRTQTVKTTRGKIRRRGVTIVESALVLSVFLLLLFGIFEYCRFLFVLHVTNNAAREGARYASVNATASTAQAATLQTAIIAYTTQMMSGVQNQISGYQVAVYAVDPTGLTLSPPVIRAATSSTASPPVYPNPFNSSDPNAVAWNSAPFPNRIAVTIQGTYVPALPTFLFMPSTVPISITAVLGAE
jgi:Flp pilus assembly protein TadG